MIKEKVAIKYLILVYWTFFFLTGVIDKIVPDVYPFWVGADFYTLFIKLFASLEIKNPIYATITLAGVSLMEVMTFVCYLFALCSRLFKNESTSDQWFNRGVSLSILLFSFFTMGDQVFGDRFTLLEHSIFWIILVVSWVLFNHNSLLGEQSFELRFTGEVKIGLILWAATVMIISYANFGFSKNTFANKLEPVHGEEVVEGIYKFDFPFLADKRTLEYTIRSFENKHPELEINYLYTGPNELNTKKKTHMLLYVFTEEKPMEVN